MTTVTSLEFCLPLFLPKVFLFFEIQLVRQVLCKRKVWECRDSNMFHECHMIRLACKLTWLSRVSMQSCLQLKDWVALHWRDFYLYQQFSETGKKKTSYSVLLRGCAMRESQQTWIGLPLDECSNLVPATWIWKIHAKTHCGEHEKRYVPRSFHNRLQSSCSYTMCITWNDLKNLTGFSCMDSVIMNCGELFARLFAWFVSPKFYPQCLWERHCMKTIIYSKLQYSNKFN